VIAATKHQDRCDMSINKFMNTDIDIILFGQEAQVGPEAA
jgi:hypothetical protein